MFSLSILSLQEVLFEGKVDSFVVPGPEGELGILSGHMPLITVLKKGGIRVRQNEKVYSFEIERGFLEVKPDKAVVLL